MKLNLKLYKGKNRIEFINPITNVSTMKINKVKIMWSVYNVGDNEKILIDTTEHTIDKGYYSFKDLKEFLENLNCTVKLEKSGKGTITPPSSKTLYLKNIGLLLGFEKDKTLNSKETSPYIVNINGGLNTISVFCNKVDTLKNLYMGKRSEKLFDILVPSNGLFGITSNYHIETEIPLENVEITSLEINIKDNSIISDKDSYTVFMDCDLF